MKSKRHTWLISLLYQNPQGLTLNEINRQWQQSANYDHADISRTALFRARTTILSQYGILIECDRHKSDSRYHIADADRQDSMRQWLLSTFAVGNIMADHITLQDQIMLESTYALPLHLQNIMQAMKAHHLICIEYKKFTSDRPSARTLAPLALRLWNQRWYLVGTEAEPNSDLHGITPASPDLRIFSLDRILSVDITPARYRPPRHFSPQEFFAECYGVYPGIDTPAERIVLRAYGQTPHYLRALPLHHTQRELTSAGQYTDFELHLRPTPDFQKHLLTHGNGLQIIAPQHLAEEMAGRIREILNRYDELMIKDSRR